MARKELPGRPLITTDWIGGEEGSSEMGLDAGSGLVGLESTSTVSCRTFRTFSSVGSGLPATPFFWRASETARIPAAVNIKTPIHTISASQFHGRFCVHSITPSLPECVRPLGYQTSLRFMESYLPVIMGAALSQLARSSGRPI